MALGDPAPQDPRVTDTNKIQQALWTMFDDLNYGITQTYEAIVIYNNGSGGGYPSLQSVLQGGNFADAGVGNTDIEELDNTSVTSSVQKAATNVFLYTAVNTLWRDADVFIVYLPYNVPIDQYK